jgi:methylenetetrahydrofolate reductase (NADPH)
MSSPASAIELGLQQRLAELVAASSLELAPRELHRAAEMAALLPSNTCVYLPALPGLPFGRTLEAIGALRAVGLDPVPHVSARRVLDRGELRSFLKEAVQKHGVHRVLVIGGDEPRAKGPFEDSMAVIESGILAECGVKEIGVSGYPEGHPKISQQVLEEALGKKIALAGEQGLGLYVVTQFSFSPTRMVEFCSHLARTAPQVGVYIGVAGPTDPAALARYAQRCGVSVSLRALRNLGVGIAKLVTHTDPREHVIALARYARSREPSNLVGLHLYSFGGVVRTSQWMSDLIAG